MNWPELSLLALLLAAPAALGDPSPDGWRRVLPGIELEFPADHGVHPEHRTEWWYLTGNVEDADGHRFGFQFTVFRNGLGDNPPLPGDDSPRPRQVYAGHLAVTDVDAGRTRFAERLRRGGTPLAGAAAGDLDVWIEDWSLRREPSGRLLVSAGDPAAGIGLELELVPRKSLVLHGEDGYSSKGGGEGNASAYFSWTRLAVEGRLTVPGGVRPVTGEAWFDHEFGSSVLAGGVEGWDWFGLQLEDGRELMLFVLRGADGRAAAASAGTLVGRDGRARPLRRADFAVEVLARWTSPRTGASYPARWVLSLPGEDLRLEVAPLVADAELATGGSTNVVYWEGPVAVSGGARGRGYAELTGYAGSMEGRF